MEEEVNPPLSHLTYALTVTQMHAVPLGISPSPAPQLTAEVLSVLWVMGASVFVMLTKGAGAGQAPGLGFGRQRPRVHLHTTLLDSLTAEIMAFFVPSLCFPVWFGCRHMRR